MLPEKNLSFEEFLQGLTELQVIPHLRFRRSQSGDPDEHDLIFLVCNKGQKKGAHIGSSSLNDYESFKDSMSKDNYDAIINLLFDFTYTDIEYKAINK